MHRPVVLIALSALGGALLAGTAHAQVYRIVGPDGRVTYSDRPPATAPARAPQPAVMAPSATTAPATGVPLPYALQQIARRYPVTLYSSDDCPPCASGRNLLVNRGVPFSEKTLRTAEDVTALQKLAGLSSVPVLTIGGQHLKGFNDAEWSQYLDAAGYPPSSQLPAGYQPPPATPLTQPRPVKAGTPPVRVLPAASAEPAPEEPREPSIAPERSGTNPAGLRF